MSEILFGGGAQQSGRQAHVEGSNKKRRTLDELISQYKLDKVRALCLLQYSLCPAAFGSLRPTCEHFTPLPLPLPPAPAAVGSRAADGGRGARGLELAGADGGRRRRGALPRAALAAHQSSDCLQLSRSVPIQTTIQIAVTARNASGARYSNFRRVRRGECAATA